MFRYCALAQVGEVPSSMIIAPNVWRKRFNRLTIDNCIHRLLRHKCISEKVELVLFPENILFYPRYYNVTEM
jgi:hypothetical protein